MGSPTRLLLATLSLSQTHPHVPFAHPSSMTPHCVPALNPTLLSQVHGSPPGEGHNRRAPPHTPGGLRNPGAVKASPSQGPAFHQLEAASALAADSTGLTCSLPLQSFQVPASPNPQVSQPPGQRVECRQSKLARPGLASWLRHLLAVPPPSGLSSPVCDLTDNTRRAVCQLGAWHAVNTRERKAPPVHPAALRSLPTALNPCPGRCFYCVMCLCPQLDHHLP